MLSLPVERSVVSELLGKLSDAELFDERHAHARENITALFRECLRIWQEEGGSHQLHALDMLFAIAYAVLPRTFANYTLDVITILAGRMSDADEVFCALVTAIDDTLRQATDATNAKLQRGAIRLALMLVAFTGHTSLSTYYLHRDIFTSAMHIVHTNTSVDVISEASLLLSLLCTTGQTHGITSAAGLGQDPVSSAVISNAGFQPYYRKLCRYVDSTDMARIAHAISVQFGRTVQDYRIKPDQSLWRFFSQSDTNPAQGREANLPPPRIVYLVCAWLLVHISETFMQGTLEPPTGEPLVVNLFTLSSYLLTYASNSGRASAYANTALQVIVALLGSTDISEKRTVRDRLLLDEVQRSEYHIERGRKCQSILVDRVELCRQRANPLPLPPTEGDKRPRRSVVLVLDNACIFLKYNKSKKLDGPDHITAFTAIQRVVILCAQADVLLEYDWRELWQALLSTAAFLTLRFNELGIREEVARVGQSLLDTLAVLLVYSEKYLQKTAEVHSLLYELARNSDVLHRLALSVQAATKKGSIPRNALAACSWPWLQEVLHTVDAKIEAWRETPPSASYLFSRSAAKRVASPAVILQIIQSLDLSTLLHPEAPACAAVLSASKRSTGRRDDKRMGAPSPSAVLLRFLQQDLLSMLI
ncbi:hypothetical protein MVES1_001049 [Malassezia vespertilionis]|nr:uncharacterized protein MVES1_001049 [Malassezia vespertilionis]WFD05716.1 hypothetical protein MVES1_001049 [Malassezia vespertilionis]